MANHLTEGLAGAPEAIGKAVTKVNDCSSGLRRAVEATFIAGAEDTHHLLEGVGHGVLKMAWASQRRPWKRLPRRRSTRLSW